jgi:hypothetical protein
MDCVSAATYYREFSVLEKSKGDRYAESGSHIIGTI